MPVRAELDILARRPGGTRFHGAESPLRAVWLSTRASRPWRFRNRRATNHPRTSFETRVLGTPPRRWFMVDGVFASASDVVIVRFLSIYAIALGASNAEIGWLAIANGLAGALALAPGAWIAERVHSRKLVVLLTGGGVGRVALLLMAGAPLWMANHQAVYALVVLTGLRWFAGSLGHPSWISLLSDIVPVDLRRLYVSRRMLAIAVVAAVGAPLAGFAIRWLGGVDSVSAYQWVFLGAFVLGVVSTFAYSRIAEPPRPPHAERPRGSTREMLRDRAFVRFMGGTLLLHSFTMIAGPFFAAYLVRNLGANAAEVGILATVDATSAVVGQYLAGGFAMRWGSMRLMIGSMFLLPLLPLLWAVSQQPWHTAIPNLLGGGAWAAWNLAAFNLVLEYAPEDNLPRYAASHQTMVLAASLIGPVIGTAIVAAYGLRAAMVVSAIGRVFALGVMMWPGGGGAAAEESAAVGADSSADAPRATRADAVADRQRPAQQV